jgi:hypothetical protein
MVVGVSVCGGVMVAVEQSAHCSLNLREQVMAIPSPHDVASAFHVYGPSLAPCPSLRPVSPHAVPPCSRLRVTRVQIDAHH